jgi:2-phospho-L-lactate guanylyltransferase
MQATAIVPLKGFSIAKERLAASLSEPDRRRLAAATAARVITACTATGLATRIVGSDPEVVALAESLGAETMPDPGGGLNMAATAAVADAAPWLVVHGDLPLLDAATVQGVADLVSDGQWVLAPSRDGGTNLLAGTGRFEFAYGPGSFHRHLGRAGRHLHRIVISSATAVEIDTPADLAAASRLPGGGWLTEFLS